MGKSSGMILAAGGIALAGNFVRSEGFPENGYGTIAATCVLVFLASTLENGRFSQAAQWIAGGMLLTALIVYVPVFSNSQKETNNG